MISGEVVRAWAADELFVDEEISDDRIKVLTTKTGPEQVAFLKVKELARLERMVSLFWDYFNVADEIYLPEDCGLNDLDIRFVVRAKEASDVWGLSWPPYLPEAEELLNDIRNGRRSL